MKSTFTSILLLCLFHSICFCQEYYVTNCNAISSVNELSSIDNLTVSIEPYFNTNIEYVCNNSGDIDGPYWIGFSLDPNFEYNFSITSNNCTTEQGPPENIGVQLAIYDTCDPNASALYCNTEANVGSINITEEITLEPNKTYYLLLDSYAGSTCDVSINVERYLPMESITDWYHAVGGFLGSSTYWYRDIGDTIINGLEYRTIDVYPEPDFPFNRYLREEISTKKVYTYNSFTEQENLLYDFDATIGDDINISNTGTYTVINIDEVESEYGNLKRWELDGPGPSIYVIEGIGSADLFLANTASDPVFGLLCAYHENDKIFGNDDCMPPPRWVTSDSLLSVDICEGDSYLFGGIEYQESGIYIDSLTNSMGADSIVTLDLSVLPISITNIEQVLCEGESITINGTIFDEFSPAGNIIITNGAANGCDSIINVNVSFIPIIVENYEAIICEGSSEIWAETMITEAGDYTFNLISSVGCDSIINLSVEVIDDIINETNVTVCEGETIIIDGEEITQSGTYQTVYEAANGCDSVVVLNVNFLSTVTIEETLFFCPDDPIIIDGNPVAEGVYETILTDINGCDSISILTVIALSESDPECLSSIYDLEALQLVLSPNPFQQIINLSTEEIIESVEILSLDGKRLDYIDKINDRKYNYDGSRLPFGIFLMAVRSNKKIAIEKVIKY